MRSYVWIILVVAFLAFCVFCYDKHADRKVGELKTQVRGQAEAVAILKYAVSITPEEVRNEIFFDRIKENFPHVENHIELLYLIKIEKKEEEEGKEVDAEGKKTEEVTKEGKAQVAQSV